MNHLILLAASLFIYGAAPFAIQTQQELTIAVRDGTGAPLEGVPVQLLVSGPPHQPYGDCVTSYDGACSFDLPPGAYLVRFEGAWAGLPFVPAEQQNSGALADAGGSGGGFGTYLAPGSGPQVVTFVLGKRDDQLVPLWDMSRDPQAEPQPFAVPDNPFDNPDGALAGIDLGPLDVDTIIPEATGGAQVVEGQLSIGTAPTAVPETDALPEVPEHGRSPNNTGLGLAGLAAAGALLTGLAYAARSLRRRAGEEGRDG